MLSLLSSLNNLQTWTNVLVTIIVTSMLIVQTLLDLSPVLVTMNSPEMESTVIVSSLKACMLNVKDFLFVRGYPSS